MAKSTDITDIERESIEFSRRHYEAITVGLVIQNKKSAIIYANNVASEILDVPKDELIGRTSADSRWQAIKEDGTPFPLEDYPAMVTLRTGKPVKNVVMGIST
ncbi:MAG TPA: PAS domain-containing protein, partial [Armatimonadota bacterium]|nr:PAS domain-containing protein [Armatimonadota bacterium]